MNLESELANIKYPRSYDHKKWGLFLGRKLKPGEYNILRNVDSEKNFNKSMKTLYKACDEYKMYVPYLTKLNGNCLYDSLSHHKIGSSINEYRQGLAFIMYIFRNYKNLLPNDTDTLLTKFTIANIGEGTKYVGCRNKSMPKGEKKFYKYTYEVMCQDLTNDGSWSRIEPHLIFAVLSLLYRIEIVILTIIEKTYSKTIINVYQNCDQKPELKTIYIANIDNFHYIPIDILPKDMIAKKLYYNDAYKEYKKWAQKMEKEQRELYVITRQSLMDEEENKPIMNNIEFTDYYNLNTSGDRVDFINYQ